VALAEAIEKLGGKAVVEKAQRTEEGSITGEIQELQVEVIHCQALQKRSPSMRRRNCRKRYSSRGSRTSKEQNNMENIYWKKF